MKIIKYKTLPGTNTTAYEAARAGCEEFYTVLAEAQTAGRGRGDHRFFSPEGGLYFSTVLHPELPLADLGKLTPFAAVAVRRAVARACGHQLAVKWVNDLLLGGKKVGGILAESGVDTMGRRFVVLGIGINTGNTAFPAEIAEIAANLPCDDKEELLFAILAELSLYERAIKEGSWLAEYRANLAFLGENVVFSIKGEPREAICRGITDNGELLLEGACGTEAFAFGEISLKPWQKHT